MLTKNFSSLQFQNIQDPATPAFVQAWQLYEQAFPTKERRNLNQQMQLLKNQKYQFTALFLEQQFVGFTGVWQLSDFCFLEHFAISPAFRGAGLGKQALRQLLANIANPWVLEVEPPTSPENERRIWFYQHAGFKVNEAGYLQPPYQTGQPWVPLQLMSYPTVLEQEQLETVVQALYQQVYQVVS